jgi:hypothetical protein
MKNLAYLLGVIFILVASQSGCSPRILPVAPEGILYGKVTVGPLQPVERVGVPSPTPPPEVFTSRSINIFQADGKTLLRNVHFNANGSYRVNLPPGTYVIDIPHDRGLGFAKNLPKTVSIGSNQMVELDIDIDTGIR